MQGVDLENAGYRHGGERTEFARDWLDFSVNLNPLGMPDGVRMAISGAAYDAGRYPTFLEYETLRGAIARAETVCGLKMSDAESDAILSDDMGVIRADDILLGNGASELIHALILGLRPKTVMLQTPNFYGYERALRTCGADLILLGADEPVERREQTGFALPSDTPAKIRQKKPDLVCLCNPCNPTGSTIDGALLEEIAVSCDEVKCHLLIDECFLPFCADYRERTMAKGIADGSRSYVTVIRAFTKLYAMPGVRLGYAIVGDAMKSLQPERFLPEWNVSTIAVSAGMAALDAERGMETDFAYTRRTVVFLQNERERVKTELWKLERSGANADETASPVICVLGGEANFIFFRSAIELDAPLAERGICVRRCDNYWGMDEPRGGFYYRVAIRQQDENDMLLNALREIITAK